MDLAELYRSIPAIERRLRATYRAQRRPSNGPFRPEIDLLEEFSLRGGKRFRALMVLAGYHLGTGKPPDPVLPAAAALEHFQSWMLIHDDIIDHAEERRGGPSVHRSLERSHRAGGGLGDAEAIGVGLGITLGDLEEPFTVEGLLSVRVPPARTMRALSEYVRMTRLTAFGQILDIRNGARPIADVTESDVLLVHRLKSAIYTVASPLRIGAALGGASDGLLAELDAFGTDVGIAFQLRDDVLGAGFEASASGKSANDLVEGKRTLLVVEAWKRADPAGRAVLGGVVGRSDATPAQVEAARSVIERSGSLAYSEKRIRTLADRAYRRVRSSRRIDLAGRRLLLEIGERLVHRRS